jgi:hypothetical protein
MLAILLVTTMVAAVRGTALGDGGAYRALASHRQKEAGLLVTAGFKPEEGGDFWRRDGVCFAREAALQHAWQKRREHKGRNTSEEA